MENVLTLEGLETVFECQTEEENCPFDWFKEGDKLTTITKHLTMETLPGNIYKLTISQTLLSDGGKYTIKMNGVVSEAILKVEGNQVQCIFFINVSLNVQQLISKT